MWPLGPLPPPSNVSKLVATCVGIVGRLGSHGLLGPPWSTMVQLLVSRHFEICKLALLLQSSAMKIMKVIEKKWPLTRNVFSRIKMSRHRFACAHIIWRNRTQTRMLQPAFFSWSLNTVTMISTASNLQEHECERYHLSETWAKNDMIKVPVFKVM